MIRFSKSLLRGLTDPRRQSLAPAVHEMPGNPRSGLHPRAVDRHSGTVGGSVS